MLDRGLDDFRGLDPAPERPLLVARALPDERVLLNGRESPVLREDDAGRDDAVRDDAVRDDERDDAARDLEPPVARGLFDRDPLGRAPPDRFLPSPSSATGLTRSLRIFTDSILG